MNIENTEKEKEVKQLLILIDSQMKEEFNIKCMKNQTSMADVLRNYITEYINNN